MCVCVCVREPEMKNNIPSKWWAYHVSKYQKPEEDILTKWWACHVSKYQNLSRTYLTRGMGGRSMREGA